MLYILSLSDISTLEVITLTIALTIDKAWTNTSDLSAFVVRVKCEHRNEERSTGMHPEQRQSCGWRCCFQPKWLQVFANTRTFIVVYGLLGTIQATAFIYFVVTLSTLEKRFQIPSRTMGGSSWCMHHLSTRLLSFFIFIRLFLSFLTCELIIINVECNQVWCSAAMKSHRFFSPWFWPILAGIVIVHCGWLGEWHFAVYHAISWLYHIFSMVPALNCNILYRNINRKHIETSLLCHPL